MVDTLISFADLYRNNGGYSAARLLYEDALGINEKKWGPDHWEVAATLVGFARLEVAQGRISEADSYFKRATAITERIQGKSPIFSYNQACYSALLNDRDQAIRILKQAVARGFDSTYKMAHDPDLASLRGDPEFEAIIKAVP